MFGATTTSSEHSIGNPFATKPFGMTTIFGSPIGMSSGTTTGLFGATPSPFQSTTTFSVPSSPAFGGSKTAFKSFSSAPALGFSSAPAFGFNSTGFGGSSVFGQKPAFGASSTTEVGFSSTPTFGNSSMVVGSRKDLNGTTNSSFGTQSSFSGSQVTTAPFGRTTLFGSPIGMSNSSGTTTGLFGATPSPLQSTTTFSVPSSPAFGSFSSAPAVGFSSAPALGSSSSCFGGSSVFGQKPAFGASCTTEVGISSTPNFGNSSMVVGSRKDLNGTTNSSFGTQSSFSGSQVTTAPFGRTTPFGSAIGMSNSSGTTTGLFGATPSPLQSTTTFSVPSSSPAFGSFSSAPALGFSSSCFGGSSVFGQKPAFGASSTTEVGFSSTPTFGNSSMVVGSRKDLNGTTNSSFGTQSSFSGSQVTTAPFGSTSNGQFVFGCQMRGSRIATYERTVEIGTNEKQAENLESISAMPVYKDKSHEELRCEDYQFGDKGGIASHNLNPFSATTPSTSQAFPSLNPFFYSTTAPSTVSTKSLTNSSHRLNPFSATTPSTSQAFPSLNPFFSSTTAPSTVSTKSLTTSSCTPSTSVTPPDFSFSPVHPPTSFPPATPAIHFTSTCPAGFSTVLNSHAIGGSSFVNSISTTSVPIPSTTLTISASPLFASSSSISNSTSSPGVSPGLSFTGTQPSPLLNSSLLSPAPQTCIAGEASGHNVIAQGMSYSRPGSQATAAGHWPSGVNPFGSLPPILKMSIDGPGSSPAVQYGISNLPVQNKPAPVRVSSLLTVRHLSQRKKLPVQKYDPKDNGHKVSFFSDNNEMPNSLFVPRENPRALVIRPSEHWPLTADSEKLPGLGEKRSTIHLNENGENSIGDDVSNCSDTPNLELADDLTKVRDLPLKVLEVEALLPKLQLSGCYTEPRIQELAAKEREDPGFCSRVKNFVVGRHGYGSIMFMGEIDVRKLDLESCVQFNYREVIVYEDESKKPPVGQGLNNPAEVTLLNIKCTDKKTGNQFIDGPKVEKYREMLMKKAAAQGAEFVSYDPVGGEWKFRVQHF